MESTERGSTGGRANEGDFGGDRNRTEFRVYPELFDGNDVTSDADTWNEEDDNSDGVVRGESNTSGEDALSNGLEEDLGLFSQFGDVAVNQQDEEDDNVDLDCGDDSSSD